MLISTPVIAKDPEKGLEIAKEMKKRDQGWGDSVADTIMILRSPDGQESERVLQVRTLEIEDDGDKSLTIFYEPRDVSGTAFLSFSHAIEPDEQWIYLSEAKIVKRILSHNKSGPFMGSEFAYEDMSSFEIEKFTYAYLRDETYNGMECFVVEQYPEYENSGYTKQVVWVDKAHYRAQKIEFYDRKDALLKILTLGDYEQYNGKHWRALRSDMDNAQTGKSTTLLIENIKFKTGVDESDFNKNALRRVR
ncbi:outer membrane lipoprotein-sorting protein [Glaciecola sp. 1036]|uniref:outer membrane lipoprotein-sorting protein n=1 Tax=Alteromonadaceae TaxID=72275 RepID=UPI003D0235C4